MNSLREITIQSINLSVTHTLFLRTWTPPEKISPSLCFRYVLTVRSIPPPVSPKYFLDPVFLFLFTMDLLTSIFFLRINLCLAVSRYSGRVSLMAPFLYYRFVKLRYASQRNPYNRNVFYELKLHAHQLATHPSCPTIAQRGIYFVVRFIESRAD